MSPGIVHSSPLFKKSNILNFEDKINNLLLSIFKNQFIFCSEIHNYDAVSSSTGKLFKPSYRTASYGKNYIIVSANNCWNKTQNMLGGQSFKSHHPTRIKNILAQRCINKYQ